MILRFRAMRSLSLVLGLLTLAMLARAQSVPFTRVIEGPLVNDSLNATGLCIVDYDGDGLLDIYLSNINNPAGNRNSLFRNLGNAAFEKMEGIPVVDEVTGGGAYASTWADFEGDGDLDVVVAYMTTKACMLYLNDGSGGFEETLNGPGNLGPLGSTTASWIDYDLDGDLDLFVGNTWGPIPPTQNDWPGHEDQLYRNDDGTLNRITGDTIVTDVDRTYGASWGDYDNDGYPDLVTTNAPTRSDLFHNNGDGSFSLMPISLLGPDSTQGGCLWADYDNDGDLDLFVAGGDAEPSLLYNNDGTGSLSIAQNHGIMLNSFVTRSGVWADYDNDGDLDFLALLRSYDEGGSPIDFRVCLFENQGDGTFSPLDNALPDCNTWTVTNAMWGDLDRDGDLDVFLPRYDPAFAARPEYTNDLLYLNNGNGNHWITIKPVGSISNRSAVGVKVRLRAVINSLPVWQFQELQTMTAYRAQPPLELHFGIGDAGQIDSLILQWPSGIMDIFSGIAPNQFLTVNEGSSDIDGDGVTALTDNCPTIANPTQADANHDGIGDACCCAGLTGNVDCDPTGGVDISDLSALIDNLYISFAPLCCPNEANTDGQPGIDISDLSALIDFLYITFTPTAECQ